MLNKVQIIGRLGRDPELKYTQTGLAVTTLNVATDEGYKDQQGNRVEKTEWHRVSVFGKSAENCSNYLNKGSLVYVEGSLQTRKWQDQQGQDRYSTDVKAQRVQFLDKKSDRDGSGGSYAAQGSQGSYAPQDNQAGYSGSQQKASNKRVQDEDLGPAFPSEASDMDDVPF